MLVLALDVNWHVGVECQRRMIRFIRVRKMAGYKNNSSSNAHSHLRPVDQIYLYGKVQSHRIVSRFTRLREKV